uniref:Uncharacterized protein n=1 Tax=Arundo donax TaxID=35708 RepID=A0A0A9E5I7_ARUDO
MTVRLARNESQEKLLMMKELRQRKSHNLLRLKTDNASHTTF